MTWPLCATGNGVLTNPIVCSVAEIELLITAIVLTEVCLKFE